MYRGACTESYRGGCREHGHEFTVYDVDTPIKWSEYSETYEHLPSNALLLTNIGEGNIDCSYSATF